MPYVLDSVLFHSPLLIAYTVGAVLILTRWGRHPKVSLLAFLGVVILTLLALVRSADLYYVWLFFGPFLSVVVIHVVEAGAFLLLLAAALSGREQAPPPSGAWRPEEERWRPSRPDVEGDERYRPAGGP
jgi:hypothetical protein